MVLYKGVVCPFCGCLCDDLEVEVEDGKILSTKNACPVSRSKFLSHAEDRAKPMVDGREVRVEEAIEEAARILREADFPLIYGLSSTEAEAQRLAVRLAELTGASLDNTSSTCHGPTVLAAQECGAVKCTL
ncbi:MAG: formylmethanofuran dehydrogenase subunit B, partial [Candidatus Hadarchaeales archaeon]